MSKLPKYRLEPVLEQKKRAKEESERNLRDAREALDVEIQKLEELEKEKEKKLEEIERTRQKRNLKAVEGTLTVNESRQYKLFIQRLHSEVKEMDIKIYKQSRAVKKAEENVDKANDHLIHCAKEHKAMSKHREKWMKELKMEMAKKEQKLMEEIGMGQYLKRHRGEKR